MIPDENFNIKVSFCKRLWTVIKKSRLMPTNVNENELRDITSVFAFTFNPRFILGSRIYDKVLGPVCLSLCLSPNI